MWFAKVNNSLLIINTSKTFQMPLFRTIKHSDNTTIYIWKINEAKELLLKDIELTNKSKLRIDGMQSEIHKKGFISVRHLLKVAGYSDSDLFYTSDGKPHLKDGKRISITHSFGFSAIGISNCPIGIDIEKNREKIIKIAPKFVDKDSSFKEEDNLVAFLTVIWGAKESMYKIHPDGGLLFKKHLPIKDFSLRDKQTIGWINKDPYFEQYTIYFQNFELYSLVYAVND